MTVPNNAQNDQAQTEQKAQSDKEINFAAIRRQLEQEKLARQQAEERIARIEEERNAKNNDDDDSDDEPYVDRRSLDKKFKKWEQNIDQKIEKKAEEKARSLVEQERRNSYLKQNADFNEVMTPDMLQKFVEKHPGLAEGILGMPDGFERQKLVYENIKALGINKPPEQKQSIQETIDKNRRSPFYQPSGVGTSPYAGAGDFSPAGQKNAYAKLQELKSKLRL
jgi:hypothetical protein